MTDIELIEKLKDKDYVRAFGLMKPEEQECLNKVGKINCLLWSCHSCWLPVNNTGPFETRFAYAIKPEYQPKPAYINVEIENKDGWLGIDQSKTPFPLFIKMPYSFTHLHCLPSLPNFFDFWYEPDTVRFNFDNIGRVSQLMAEGKKVYARFRR